MSQPTTTSRPRHNFEFVYSDVGHALLICKCGVTRLLLKDKNEKFIVNPSLLESHCGGAA